MDFQSLPRRSLQFLCKKNKIRANATNIAMANALWSLHTVEGLDSLNQTQLLLEASPTPTPSRTPNPSRSCRKNPPLISKTSSYVKKRAKSEFPDIGTSPCSWMPKRSRTHKVEVEQPMEIPPIDVHVLVPCRAKAVCPKCTEGVRRNAKAIVTSWGELVEMRSIGVQVDDEDLEREVREVMEFEENGGLIAQGKSALDFEESCGVTNMEQRGGCYLLTDGSRDKELEDSSCPQNLEVDIQLSEVCLESSNHPAIVGDLIGCEKTPLKENGDSIVKSQESKDLTLNCRLVLEDNGGKDCSQKLHVAIDLPEMSLESSNPASSITDRIKNQQLQPPKENGGPVVDPKEGEFSNLIGSWQTSFPATEDPTVKPIESDDVRDVMQGYEHNPLLKIRDKTQEPDVREIMESQKTSLPEIEDQFVKSPEMNFRDLIGSQQTPLSMAEDPYVKSLEPNVKDMAGRQQTLLPEIEDPTVISQVSVVNGHAESQQNILPQIGDTTFNSQEPDVKDTIGSQQTACLEIEEPMENPPESNVRSLDGSQQRSMPEIEPTFVMSPESDVRGISESQETPLPENEDSVLLSQVSIVTDLSESQQDSLLEIEDATIKSHELDVRDTIGGQQTSLSEIEEPIADSPGLNSEDFVGSQRTSLSDTGNLLVKFQDSDVIDIIRSPQTSLPEIKDPFVKSQESDDNIKDLALIHVPALRSNVGKEGVYAASSCMDGEGANMGKENKEAKRNSREVRAEFETEKSKKEVELSRLSLRKLRSLCKKTKGVVKMEIEGERREVEVQGEQEKKSAKKARLNALSLRQLKSMYKHKVASI